ncbi:MAG: hypothetical protein MHMPM18_004813, partial [Marteilia pararefringens]
ALDTGLVVPASPASAFSLKHAKLSDFNHSIRKLSYQYVQCPVNASSPHYIDDNILKRLAYTVQTGCPPSDDEVEFKSCPRPQLPVEEIATNTFYGTTEKSGPAKTSISQDEMFSEDPPSETLVAEVISESNHLGCDKSVVAEGEHVACVPPPINSASKILFTDDIPIILNSLPYLIRRELRKFSIHYDDRIRITGLRQQDNKTVIKETAARPKNIKSFLAFFLNKQPKSSLNPEEQIKEGPVKSKNLKQHKQSHKQPSKQSLKYPNVIKDTSDHIPKPNRPHNQSKPNHPHKPIFSEVDNPPKVVTPRVVSKNPLGQVSFKTIKQTNATKGPNSITNFNFCCPTRTLDRFIPTLTSLCKAQSVFYKHQRKNAIDSSVSNFSLSGSMANIYAVLSNNLLNGLGPLFIPIARIPGEDDWSELSRFNLHTKVCNNPLNLTAKDSFTASRIF